MGDLLFFGLVLEDLLLFGEVFGIVFLEETFCVDFFEETFGVDFLEEALGVETFGVDFLEEHFGVDLLGVRFVVDFLVERFGVDLLDVRFGVDFLEETLGVDFFAGTFFGAFLTLALRFSLANFLVSLLLSFTSDLVTTAFFLLTFFFFTALVGNFSTFSTFLVDLDLLRVVFRPGAAFFGTDFALLAFLGFALTGAGCFFSTVFSDFSAAFLFFSSTFFFTTFLGDLDLSLAFLTVYLTDDLVFRVLTRVFAAYSTFLTGFFLATAFLIVLVGDLGGGVCDLFTEDFPLLTATFGFASAGFFVDFAGVAFLAGFFGLDLISLDSLLKSPFVI